MCEKTLFRSQFNVVIGACAFFLCPQCLAKAEKFLGVD